MSSPVYLRPNQTEREFNAIRATLRSAEKQEKRSTDWPTSAFLALVILILAVPAVMAVWPRPALIAADNRGVVITGPVVAFEQSAAQLRIRLNDMPKGRTIVVTSGNPDAAEVVVPAKKGWTEVNLPPSLVAASSLDVSIR